MRGPKFQRYTVPESRFQTNICTVLTFAGMRGLRFQATQPWLPKNPSLTYQRATYSIYICKQV